MSDVNDATDGGGSEPATVITPADQSAQYSSPHAAAKALAELRWSKRNEQQAAAQPEGAAAAPEPDPAQAETADPETDPGETDQQQPDPEAEKLPPIAPPGSWSKAEKEEFLTYPREAQEKIARREQERDTAVRRAQNEAADQRKQLSEKLTQADQLRQQYEQTLPMLLGTLQQQQQGEFADIKTMADVERLAREDWPRYALWDAQQKKIAAVSQEVQAANQRQESERHQKWSTYASEQDKLFLEKHSDLADKAVAEKVTKQAYDYLQDIGYSESELAKLWNESEAFRDHRLQSVVRDAIRYREAQAKVKAAAVKPKSAVQQPGAAQVGSSTLQSQIQALEQELDKTGSLKVAQQLRVLRGQAASRGRR